MTNLAKPSPFLKKKPALPKETQQLIREIKTAVSGTLQDFDVEPSFLNRLLSKYEYSGTVLRMFKYTISVGLGAVGVLLLNPYLLGSALTSYTSLQVLENHHENFMLKTQLKRQVISLGNIVEKQCVFLATQTEKLKIQVKKLTEQMSHLKGHCKDLSHQVVSLKSEVVTLEKLIKKLELTSQNQEKVLKQLKQQEVTLGKEIKKLEAQIKGLEGHDEAQKKIVIKLKELQQEQKTIIQEQEQTIKQLKITEKKLAGTEEKFAALVVDLKETKEKMDETAKAYASSEEKLAAALSDLKELQVIQQTLQGTVVDLSALMITDKATRAAYLTKLDVFLSDKSKSFHEAVSRISDTERELSELKVQFADKNEVYDKLLKSHQNLLRQQEGQLERLEKIGATKTHQPDRTKASSNSVSFFLETRPTPQNGKKATHIQTETLMGEILADEHRSSTSKSARRASF